MNIIKTMFFLIFIPGPLLFWAPYKIALLSPIGQFNLGQLRYAALLPWPAGTVILLWSCWEFTFRGRGTPAPIDPPKVIVGEGLYRFVRNPMYLGALLILLGHILWFQSLRLLIYAAALTAAFHLFVVFYEEPVLRRKFGDSYEDYCRR
ncbi:MAG: isoprenylcysteine carboxylmethyltransferase family protein, partial [Calditrichales bacterium]